MPSILLTGTCTLDIINSVSSYPAEDSEVRALAQCLRTGGNASNSALVLQQLGFQASLLANRADDENAHYIFSQLEARHIDTSLCPVQTNSSTPTSYITVSQSTGSRSIVHYRNLDELESRYFLGLDLSAFDWLHFEARHCLQLLPMLQYAKSVNKPVSLELEKPRDSIDLVMPFADLLFISKPFAKSRGFSNAEDCLQHFSQRYADKLITCTWGAQGAWAYTGNEIIHQPAQAIKSPLETLGAGDTFNAAFIAAQLRQLSVKDALQHACQLAEYKCQQTGFDNLPEQSLI